MAKYFRAFKLEADSVNAVKSLGIRDADTNSLHAYTGGPAPSQVQHNGQSQIEYTFTTPFVAHLVRDEPQDTVSWRRFGIEWMADEWPELAKDPSPWLSAGTPGAKYMRKLVLPIDTNGNPVQIAVTSSDMVSEIFGPFTTSAAVKTPVAMAFTIPNVAHELQIIPQSACRIWFDEALWEYDPWPELISEATGWMPIRSGSAAAFLQGLTIPIESDGAAPSLQLKTDGGATVALIATVIPSAKVKTSVPFSLATPVIAHQVQLIPQAPCRLWDREIIWHSQATPELASTWKTQPTAHGLKGYQFIARIEAAYASAQPVTMAFAAFDGTSPNSITLPATGGAYQRILITPSVNKFQLMTYSATSTAPFQLFLNDCVIWLGVWGRTGEYIPYRNLGASFGDSAAI